jgi:cytochrome c-type biogenesis protein CcmH
MPEPMREQLRRLIATATLTLLAVTAFAKDAAPASADPVLEARMTRITSELRCLVCQNQTIAYSNADLAADLRRQTRELLLQGKSDSEVVDYMTARYGDFVLYRPPLRTTTVLLWFGPAVMLLGGAAVLVVVLRRRSRLPSDAFDVDEDDALAEASDPAAPAESARGAPAAAGA